MKLFSKEDSAKKFSVTAKQREELQLPKINKTMPIDSNTSQIMTRYEWLNRDKDYSIFSMNEIEQEYQQLRKELVTINEIAARTVQRMNLKPLRKSKNFNTMENVGEVRDKEIENNQAIIGRLKYQYEQLQKRAVSIEEMGKDELDSAITKLKEQLPKMKIKNKQLKLKSKEIGESIENGDDIFIEVRKLEVERDIIEKKKAKLVERWNQTKNNMEKVQIQLREINGGSQEANQFIEEQLQCQKHNEEEKKMEFALRQKNYQLQIVRRNGESIKNLKQQKYHQMLKQLQLMVKKVEVEQQRIFDSQQKNISQKKQITDLEAKLSELLSQATDRSKTSEDQNTNTLFYTAVEEKQNDVGKQGNHIKVPLNVKRTSPSRFNKKNNQYSMDAIQLEQADRKKQHSGRIITSQHNKTAGKIATQKDRPFNKIANVKIVTGKSTLEPNSKSDEKKIHCEVAKTQQIHKYDIDLFRGNSQTEKDSQKGVKLKKQSNLIYKTIQHGSINNQQPKQRKSLEHQQFTQILKQKQKQVKMNSKRQVKYQIEKQIPIQLKKTQIVNKNVNQKQFQQIMQQLDDMINNQPPKQIKPTKDLKLKLNQKQQQRDQQIIQNKHINNSLKLGQDEDEDESLQDFHRSINIQKQNIQQNKITINIPLGDIESNIRKNQKIIKQNKYKPHQEIINQEESFS